MPFLALVLELRYILPTSLDMYVVLFSNFFDNEGFDLQVFIAIWIDWFEFLIPSRKVLPCLLHRMEHHIVPGFYNFL